MCGSAFQGSSFFIRNNTRPSQISNKSRRLSHRFARHLGAETTFTAPEEVKVTLRFGRRLSSTDDMGPSVSKWPRTARHTTRRGFCRKPSKEADMPVPRSATGPPTAPGCSAFYRSSPAEQPAPPMAAAPPQKPLHQAERNASQLQGWFAARWWFRCFRVRALAARGNAPACSRRGVSTTSTLLLSAALRWLLTIGLARAETRASGTVSGASARPPSPVAQRPS